MIDVKTIMIAINTILLAITTVYLARLIIDGINIKTVARHVKSGYNTINDAYHDRQLAREAKRHTRTISINMSLVDKVELFLIDKSNIRRYIPFMSFYVLVMISGIIFALTFSVVYRVINFAPSTAVICLIFAAMPFYVLDLLGKANSEKARRNLANFISVLLRWSVVKEDIFNAFEKSIDSGIGEPLKTYIRDMVIQVKRGMNPIQALEILQLKIDNELFTDFILNIKQCIKNQGDIIKLLGNMEKQFYDIEKEYNRRRISTYRDKLVILAVMLVVLLIGYALLQMPKVNLFYLGTNEGKLLLMLFAILYAAGFIQFNRITKFKH